MSVPLEQREDLIDQLNVALGTTMDLYSQVKQAHWNIKGPQFFARHKLFDALADRLRLAADELAERASTLGGYAEGTVRMATESTTLREYDVHAIAGPAHVRALSMRYTEYTSFLRVAHQRAEELGDPVTADLYLEILRASEKDLWFLESHINV